MQPPMREQDFLVNVQFVRFVGALLVVLYHTWQGPHTDMNMTDPLFGAISVFGFAGVDMLFVVSGFIIYYTTSKPDTKIHPGVFIYQRFARVYLGYWPFYFMAAAALLFTNKIRLAEIDLLSSFFLLPDKLGAMLIGASWTLPYELYFYTLFFFLFFTPHRMRLIAFIAIAIIAFNVYAAWAFNAYTWKGYRNLGEYQRFFTSPWLLEFLAGCWAAYAVRQGHKRFHQAALFLGLGLFAVAIALNLYVLDGKIAKFFNHHYRLSLFGGGTALILYGLVNLEQRGFTLFPRMSLLLGNATYSLYLCHTIILDSLGFAGVYAWCLTMPVPPVVWLWLLIALMLLFAVLFYSWVEKPIYAWARKQVYRFV